MKKLSKINLSLLVYMSLAFAANIALANQKGGIPLQDSKAVIVVPMSYIDGTWRVDQSKARILPCAAPSKFHVGTPEDPSVEVLGKKGKTLFRKSFRNPRIIISENDGRNITRPRVLSRVSFNLRIPYVKGMRDFGFKPPRNDNGGTLTHKFSLSEYVRVFRKFQRRNPKIQCQDIEYKPDQRK